MKPLLKILLIGGLLLLLAVPVMMLQGLVWERQQRGYQVAEDIAVERIVLVFAPIEIAVDREIETPAVAVDIEPEPGG